MTLFSEAVTTARNGVWTPWAFVLCVECDYVGLKDSGRAGHYAKHYEAVATMDRTQQVERPDGELMAVCDVCKCSCWVREDVALIQQVGYKTTELDEDGPFGWGLEQTGGMCSALVFSTEGRKIVVTAMISDVTFDIGEYVHTDGEEESWDHPLRTWESSSFYEGDTLKDAATLAAIVEECARKVIEFVHSSAPDQTEAQP